MAALGARLAWNVTRIPIKYGTARVAAHDVSASRRARAYLERTGDDIEVRMGWAFRDAARGAATSSATNRYGRSISIGVHGWRGRWLVNGASEPIVGLELREPVPGRVSGSPCSCGS